MTRASISGENFPLLEGSGLLAGIGVDRIKVTFPVVEAARIRSEVQVEEAHWHISVGGPGDQWGSLEGNPSRVTDPLGHGLSNPGEALEVLRMVWDLLPVAPAVPFEKAAVKRLDVARDFEGVENVASYVEALRPLPRAYARRVYLYYEPRRGHAASLVVHGGRSAGRAVLYDKALETMGEVATGTTRFEAQCRGWTRRFGHMIQVADVTEEKVIALARDRWKWSRFGTPIASGPTLIERVDALNMSAASKRSSLGAVLFETHGRPTPMSPQSRALMRRMVREVGIVPRTDVFMRPEAAFAGYLDFESGTEVRTDGTLA